MYRLSKFNIRTKNVLINNSHEFYKALQYTLGASNHNAAPCFRWLVGIV